MKKLFKPFVMILLIGMTFLSGGARDLLGKSAQAAPRDGGREGPVREGASCG